MTGGHNYYCTSWLTDMGPFFAMATDSGLAALYIRPMDPDEAAQEIIGPGAAPPLERETSLLARVRDQVDAYLTDGLAAFDLPLDFQGTDFQQAVWRALLRVPYGRVVTYAQLAAMAGRPGAARAVGNAVGANPIPIIIPCHRVVASGGLGGFSSGLARKVTLLGIEGVTEGDLNRARLEAGR